jgi:hypothetical protein
MMSAVSNGKIFPLAMLALTAMAIALTRAAFAIRWYSTT